MDHTAQLAVRTSNHSRFMDVEHEPAKPPHAFRVGYFGYSSVEAGGRVYDDCWAPGVHIAIAEFSTESFRSVLAARGRSAS
jgi:hypothetical protein